MKKKTSQLLQVVSLILLVVSVLGCHAKREVTPPDMFPVSGKVVSSNTPLPKGYQIQFTQEDVEKTAVSDIQPDGTFKMTTYYMGTQLCDGVAKGNYAVSLVPPFELGVQGVMPTRLPQKINVEKEITDLKIPYQSR